MDNGNKKRKKEMDANVILVYFVSHWEDRTPTKKVSLLDWPVGKPMGHFID